MATEEYWEGALMGGRWLAEHQNPDGSWIGLSAPREEAYYKSSWALMLTGHPAAAHRSLTYSRQALMDADGDFGPREYAWHRDVNHPYSNAYYVVGGMLAARYEVVAPAVRFLLSQQDPRRGGFYSRRTAGGGSCLTDSMSTSGAAVAMLAAGQLEAACRAADYLARLVELQPAPGERFYFTLECDGRLGTEFQDDAEAWRRVIDRRAARQCWYAAGLPFAFLVLLAEATGETRYRSLAEWYFDFQAGCVDPWIGPSSGKAGWGSAMMYRITGEKRYREVAFQVADMMQGKQLPAGNWTWATGVLGQAGDPAAAPAPNDFDLTSEYTLWLALIASNVAARDGGVA